MLIEDDIETIAEADRNQFMDVIRAELYKLDKGEMERAGRRIDRTYDCLIRIRSGRTMWPLAKTLFALVQVLGLRLILVSPEEARTRGLRVGSTTVTHSTENRVTH